MAPAGSTILTEGVLRGVADDTTVAVFGGLVAGRGGLETAERNKDNLVNLGGDFTLKLGFQAKYMDFRCPRAFEMPIKAP